MIYIQLAIMVNYVNRWQYKYKFKVKIHKTFSPLDFYGFIYILCVFCTLGLPIFQFACHSNNTNNIIDNLHLASMLVMVDELQTL